MGSKTKNKGTSSLVQDPPRLFEFDTVGEMDVSSDDEIPEKDEAEEKLERLLFGDDDGFQAALKSHNHYGEQQTTELVRKSGQDGTDGEDAENEEDMENMDDADVFFPRLFFCYCLVTDCVQLFFLDAGAAETSGALVLQPGTPQSDEEQNEPAVWADSDDERMAISLAGHNRLRKLRDTEVEDVVSGKEYIKRLRRQYLRLHPTPGWANPAASSKRRKHANSSDNESDEIASSDEDGMDTDDEVDLSTQPLARLLQGAGDLIRGSEDIKSGERRKLRQEVIDIQRLKDVGGVQPVSYPSF